MSFAVKSALWLPLLLLTPACWHSPDRPAVQTQPNAQAPQRQAVLAPPPEEAAAPPQQPLEERVEQGEPQGATDAEQDDRDANGAFVCAPRDRGWGRYLPYVRLSLGRMTLPSLDALPADGAHDVYVHFHGSDAVRRVFVHEGYPMVFVGVDLGEGSKSYKRAFEDPQAWQRLRTSIESALREQTGDPGAHIGRVFLSSWSAGFGASTRILASAPDDVQGVVLLDSLYAPYAKDARGADRKGVVFTPSLRDIVAFGKQALASSKLLYLTYSNVPTYGYASTGEVASHLLERLGVKSKAVAVDGDPRGLRARLDDGQLHVRGYRGADARAHCAHLAQAAQAVREIQRTYR